MCELLGMCFNKKVKPYISFRGLMGRSRRNPHGWGIARWVGGVWQVFKEPIRANTSSLANFVQHYPTFESKMFVGHVRYATRGIKAFKNTHPFVRPFRRREVIFAHNGSISMRFGSRLKFFPVGDTDSEKLFCHILTEMSRNNLNISFSDFYAIENLMRRFNQYGTMNILFSNGNYLYVYRDIHGHRNLFLLERRSPFGIIYICDEDWEIDMDLGKDASTYGVIIASKPLTKGESWIPIPNGNLKVFKNGRCIY